MSHLVTITGASGHIGHALAQQLLEKGIRIRVVARQASRVKDLAARGAEVKAGNLEDAVFAASACQGAAAVFVMIPPHYTVTDIRADQRRIAQSLTAALKQAGVPRVVALSSIGANLVAGTGPIAGLHEFEEMLKTVPGLAAVVLRPAYFMENLLGAIPIIKSTGSNSGATRPDTPLPMIATRDIAAVAAQYLATVQFDGLQTQELLGPQDVTLTEATAILGAAIGRPALPYVQLSYVDFRRGLLGAGFSPNAADAFVEMQGAFNAGLVQRQLTRTARNSTPTTLAQFAQEVFAPAWRAA